jgi:serine/threonine protein kinase
MKVVAHNNVVKMYEVLASKSKIFIVLELVTGGELFDKIVAEKHFDEEKSRFYYRQLVTGVAYCHGRGIFHRDLKVRA